MNETNIPERLRQQALAGLLPEHGADAVGTATGDPRGESDGDLAAQALLSLPEGWEDAIDTWVRVGCPKGDPIIFGLNLLVLRSLAQLPPEQRLPHLRDWQRRIAERRKNAGQ